MKDENGNYIPDEWEDGYNELVEELGEKKDSWKTKLKAFFDKKGIAIGILSFLLISCFVWIAQSETEVKEIIKTEKVESTLKLKDGVVCFNANDMKVYSTKLTTSAKTGKEIFGVSRKLETPLAKIVNSDYWVRYEYVDSLKLNLDEFNKYVEKESKNAEKLSK